MRILALNAGSSSVKYELFEMDGPESLASGAVDQIGETSSSIGNHRDAFQHIADALEGQGVRGDELAAIGHRIVHGGDVFTTPAVIDDNVLAEIHELVPLAPLHNPPNLAGIEAARQQFPGPPHIAVFDTAFHATMPSRAKRYAIPAELQDDYGVRRYGFHGTSYEYVTSKAAELLGRPVDAVNLIVMHLGNGTSVCAIENGKSIDTSMGFTPLEGLVMGTRSGDIDPAVVFHLQREAGMSVDQVDRLLNRESGLKGLCGHSDMRAITDLIADGDESAAEAVDLFCYRIRKYIGAYRALLPRLDALVFTAGIGEHRPEIRARVCRGLEHLGIGVDEARNDKLSDADGFIDCGTSETRVLVVQTNEALQIARHCANLIR